MTSRAARWRRSLCWAARARGSAHRHHPWPLPRRAWESSRSRLAQAGVDGWRGGWMEGWMDGGVDGWVDGWMGVLVTRAALCTHHITTPDLSIHPSIHPPILPSNYLSIHPSIHPSTHLCPSISTQCLAPRGRSGAASRWPDTCPSPCCLRRPCGCPAGLRPN